jgi:lysophospholipase L1-like esterase
MRQFTTFLAVLFFCTNAFAAAPAIPPTAPGTPIDSYSNAPRANLGYAQQRLKPVCNGYGYPGVSLVGTAGTNVYSQTMAYCPRGAAFGAQFMNGAYATTSPAEVAFTWSMPFSAGYWPNVSPPWNSTTTYTTGQTVYWVNEQWTAQAGNTNSVPYAGSTNWSETVPASSLFSAVTAQGERTLGLPLLSRPNSTPVTQGYGITDLQALNIPAGGWLQSKQYFQLNGNQNVGSGRPVNYLFGEISIASPASDYTLTYPGSSILNSYNYGNGTSGPTAILGVPVVDGPTACIIGDSIAAGVSGDGFKSGLTTTSGGTGYTSADDGLVLTIPDTGAGTYSTGRLADGVSPASVQITIVAVSGGAATARTAYGGSYNNPSRNSGSAVPSGSQVITGGHGTGLTVTFNGSVGTGFDIGDAYNGWGYVQRGLNTAGIPHVDFVEPSDTLADWAGGVATGSNRLASVLAVGCSSVIIELGINDVTNGQTAAQMEANAIIVANAVLDAPGSAVKGVYLTTTTPNTLSTDGYETTTNQSNQINPTVRAAYNDWVRTVPSPFTAVFDPDVYVESSTDSDLWAPGGSVIGLYTIEGLHMTPYGHSRAALSISNNAGVLK